MRILYLCKRQYMGHDVIADRYARLYEQPFQLAELGHSVLGICLSYRNCAEKNERHDSHQGSMQWIGLSAGKSRLNIPFYPIKILTLARDFKPDIIVSSSDCLHVILGGWLAKKLSVPFAADLYDDYETFGLAKIPFIKTLYRKALNRAKIISCVSEALSIYIQKNYAKTSTVLALPSTINQKIFYPRSKDKSRNLFNLPLDVPLVGTAGGLSKEKGIETVYHAFLDIINLRPDIHFVLAGPIDTKYPPPKHERIHYLGMLSHEMVANLFCSLDVGIVYLRDTQYGQLSFPQKAYEMAACKIPMVVTKVGDMATLFSETRNELYAADEAIALRQAILRQVEHPNVADINIDSWVEQAKKLAYLYSAII